MIEEAILRPNQVHMGDKKDKMPLITPKVHSTFLKLGGEKDDWSIMGLLEAEGSH